MDTTATILHADLDAFYASVEQLLNPSLRGKPIAVGGGVVLAASYEAKAFGVRGGMPGRRARELCPQLIFVGGHFKDYQRLGDAAIAILGDYMPLVERISIDEAFADVAGCTHLFGSPADIAATIRHRVRTELGLPISVGVARTKHLAKIASQVAKPDGMVLVDPKAELEFLHDLPVELMWGVGPVTKAKLTEQGILHRPVGEHAGPLHRTPARHGRGRKAFGAGLESRSARDPNPTSCAVGGSAVCAWPQAGRRERVQAGAAPSRRPRCLASAREISCGQHRHGASPVRRHAGRHQIDDAGCADFGNGYAGGNCRGIGAGSACRSSAGADDHAAGDIDFTAEKAAGNPARSAARPAGRKTQARGEKSIARRAADRAIDTIRDRFGRDAVGYAATALDGPRSLPDGFRELAEKEL